jgi:hypothetical protein
MVRGVGATVGDSTGEGDGVPVALEDGGTRPQAARTRTNPTSKTPSRAFRTCITSEFRLVHGRLPAKGRESHKKRDLGLSDVNAPRQRAGATFGALECLDPAQRPDESNHRGHRCPHAARQCSQLRPSSGQTSASRGSNLLPVVPEPCQRRPRTSLCLSADACLNTKSHVAMCHAPA